MKFTAVYSGRSRVVAREGGVGLSFAPNLSRGRVSFVGDLLQPLQFREAVSALHAVVVSDLKYRPKDRSAYQAYLQRIKEEETALKRAAFDAKLRGLRQQEPEPMPDGLQPRFNDLRKRYWDARQKYSSFLARNDPALFRLLVPCDPVVTVADDVLFFECFSRDESSYGCLTIDRDAFAEQRDASNGTTNVDYSLGLYEEFQRLRTYRRARFAVDPDGFEVATGEAEAHREVKIDLPPSWLRGFMQLQAAMSLPSRRVEIGREAFYNLIVLLRRRTRQGPRAVRFELVPGRPAEIVVEPWETRIASHGPPYEGGRPESIRVWGRDRLLTTARLTPLVDSVQVHLAGSGLPSFWSIRMGGLRLLLGLSGWTSNDWTSGGGALADLAPPVEPSQDLLGDVGAAFQERSALTFFQLQQRTGAAPAPLAAALHRLALLGQLIHDLPAGLYRWRSIMPAELSLDQVRQESEESGEGASIFRQGLVKLGSDETVGGLRSLAGLVQGREVELVLDSDGRVARGRCNCSHYYQFKLKAGPCRHMLALRRAAVGGAPPAGLDQWLRAWMGN